MKWLQPVAGMDPVMWRQRQHRIRRAFHGRQQRLCDRYLREMGWRSVRFADQEPFHDWLRQRGEPVSLDDA